MRYYTLTNERLHVVPSNVNINTNFEVFFLIAVTVNMLNLSYYTIAHAITMTEENNTRSSSSIPCVQDYIVSCS